MIKLDEYFSALPGEKASENFDEMELNGTILNRMSNC